ncbi:MAG: hypothetical protein DI598_04685, partial [Pseudopedobacter saltans]
NDTNREQKTIPIPEVQPEVAKLLTVPDDTVPNNDTSNVRFASSKEDVNNAELKANSEPELQKIAKVIKEKGKKTIFIIGCPDASGDDEDYNLQLSFKRADAVKTWLLQHGLTSYDFQIEGRDQVDDIISGKSTEKNNDNQGLKIIIVKGK